MTAVAEVIDEALETAINPKEIEKATIVLALHVSLPGFRRKMRPEDVLSADEKIDPDMLHLSKDLLDVKALSEIIGLRDRLKRRLQDRVIPCRMLRGGMMLLPLKLVDEVDGWIVEFEATFEVLVDKLCIAYEGHKQEAEKRLGDHYDEREYPSLGKLRRAFSVEHKWMTYNVPAALKTFKRSIYERELDRNKKQWAEAGEEIRIAIRESLAGIVTHFAEALGVDENGKKKTFRDATMAKMNDFLDTFAARNLTDDKDLAVLVTQAKQVLKGVAPEDLRKQEIARDRVREGFAEIKAKLDALVVPAKTRRIARDEDV